MNYQQRPMCDSYFVDSHDSRARAIRDELREHERHVQQEKQTSLALCLSDLTSEEYGPEILEHMQTMELDTLPDVASIDIQTEIQWFMRPYLLDFLIEAHTAFSLAPDTLFLAINLLDRYCSKRIVYKRHYQLVGSAALLIAAKFGDQKERVPTIRELKCMCCALYDDDMFLQMEWHVLQTLGWNIGHPTIDCFIKMALDAAPDDDDEVEHMARFISEIALFHKEFVSKRPSDIARAALALGRYILDRPQAHNSDWAAQYDAQTLVALSHHLHRPSQVLSRKYSHGHLSQVSIFLDEFLAQQASIARYREAPAMPVEQKQQTAQQTGPPITPVKQQYLPSAPHGCMTPPITPNTEAPFAKGQPCPNNYQPPTPTSIGNQAVHCYYDPSARLPPINRVSSLM
ncbi:MAG: hypothetical protein Q9183_002406 [Haloplaca sp. 2 TL-2023]